MMAGGVARDAVRVEADGTALATRNDRLQWLDAARGIGIVLVVYAHAARALFDVLPHLRTFQQVDGLIYAFHMPLFFFLAGLVSPPSLARSRGRFLTGKLGTVAYPYLLWSLIYWSLELLFAKQVNSPVPAEAILSILWRPIEHLWFLYVLFVCQTLATLVWPRVLLLVGMSLWCFLGPLPAITVPALWTQLPWFTAGLLLASMARPPVASAGRQGAIALAVPLLCGVGYAVVSPFAPLDRVADFFLAGVGISLTIAAATAVRALRAVRYLGEASLSIYLMHTIFSAGTREFLEAFYPVGAVALLGITSIAGLILPLVVHELARRRGLMPYLGLGKTVAAGRR